jgi:hypothetical protein
MHGARSPHDYPWTGHLLLGYGQSTECTGDRYAKLLYRLPHVRTLTAVLPFVFSSCKLPLLGVYRTVLWFMLGYSLALGPSSAAVSSSPIIGDVQQAWLLSMKINSVHQLAPNIPETVYCTYQLGTLNALYYHARICNCSVSLQLSLSSHALSSAGVSLIGCAMLRCFYSWAAGI